MTVICPVQRATLNNKHQRKEASRNKRLASFSASEPSSLINIIEVKQATVDDQLYSR
jgi:hypothetical protein